MTIGVEVVKRIGGFNLEVGFQVPGSGITVLFGASGAGKSLTLALVAGLLRPDQGRIAINGETYDDAAASLHLPPQERKVGMAFQDSLLLPHRSVLDNVALAIPDGNRHQRRGRALSELARVGMRDRCEVPPRSLSGGELQRASLARALAGDPRLLLLDEPFSALDLPVRRKLRTLVSEAVAEREIPALLVTHDRAEAIALAPKAVLFRHGSGRQVMDAPDLPVEV